MNAKFPHLNLSIAEALRRYPGLLSVLIKYRTGCVGCPMAAFCSLQAAAEIHNLEDTEFHQDVGNFIAKSSDDSGL